MKAPLALLLCGAALFIPTRVLTTGLSETNNGIYLAIGGGGSSNEPIRFNEPLAYMPFCNTGEVRLAVAPYTYSAKMRMTGPDGKEVAKTPLGQTYGSKFEEWHKFNDVRTISVLASGPYQGLLGVVFVSTPKDLFVMKDPGTYTLEVQMQMFRFGSPPDTNAATRNPIQFSPVSIKVQKPPEPKAK